MSKILLLEDDTNLNRGITLKLTKEGYEVLSASGVTEAEVLFRENEVALIISDITMTDGNGMEFCRRIRRNSDVHIIFAALFTVGMYLIAKYEVTLKQQQMLTMLIEHPELEAEIVALWEKSLASSSASRIFISSKYVPSSFTVSHSFIHSSESSGQKMRRSGGTNEEVRELYECLERFREGDFHSIPDSKGEMRHEYNFESRKSGKILRQR